MDLLQHALQEKLTRIDEERERWQQYANDYTQAEQNLIGFRESLQKDILVPIGSKALMPGKLYHTNEIFVGMYSGLFVKCSSHKAIELCQHRLKKSKERLDALDTEYKMYKDRIELPMAEDAFGNPADAREIIEEYNEDEELKWREQHKIRVREQKQREAAERREQVQEQTEADDDTNIMDILERAELMEELENELEELNVEDDIHLQQHLQSNSMNGNASHSDQVHSDDDADFCDDEDDIVPDEFREMSRVAANMSIEEKLKFYENQLSEIRNYLSTRKFTKFEDLKELADKRGVQECLRNAIDEMAEEKAKSDPEESAPKLNGNLEMDEPDSVCTLSPPDGRKCLTVAEFKQLEHSYLDRSKSVALVFYKSQLRSVMKSIASCSKDAHGDHANEKRELYEYINDSIDRLRAEIEQERQAKLEEKFVDDDTDNEAPADDDDEDGLDIGYDMDELVTNSMNASASNADDDAVGVVSADSTIISPTKRKICFASKPSVTTYHLDDEPWRVQNSSGETDETINSLMDETFQFFNSPSSSSSSSVCDYDGHDDDVNATATSAMTNSTNKCDDDDGMKTNLCTINSSCDADDDINRLESISQEMLSASKTLYYKEGSTLYLKFAHTATPPQQPLPIGSPTVNVASLHTIKSPVDIYNQFGGDATVDESEIEKQKLKDYVLKVANLNADELQQKMANYLTGKSASSSLPNGNHASQMAKTPMAEPKKSILKNCDAVKREIHGKIFDRIGDDDPPQNFYTQDKCDPFVGFDQVLGDICERPSEIICNNNNNNNNNICKPDAAAINNDSSAPGKKRVSLFKLNRMS